VKQLREYPNEGALKLTKVPVTAVPLGGLLVHTHNSFIGIGTEKMKISRARMNHIAKARKHSDQVDQVLQTLEKQSVDLLRFFDPIVT
jgi:hypothetical protein